MCRYSSAFHFHATLPRMLGPTLITNGVRILQTQLGHREGHEARRMGLEAMPLDQHIESHHGVIANSRPS
jgi:hypothetical protein